MQTKDSQVGVEVGPVILWGIKQWAAAGEMKQLQHKRVVGDKDGGDCLAVKRAACGTVRGRMVEAGQAKLTPDVVLFVEGNKCGGELEAHETMLSAEKELNCPTRRGHAGKLRRDVYT